MKIKKVAFIGLGVMGYPMAGYLKRNQLDVTVFNRTTSKAEKWKSEYRGSFEKNLDNAVKNCDAVFIYISSLYISSYIYHHMNDFFFVRTKKNVLAI